jgi:hypothetical protein
VFFGKTLKEENGLGNNFKDHFLADRAANRAYHGNLLKGIDIWAGLKIIFDNIGNSKMFQ